MKRFAITLLVLSILVFSCNKTKSDGIYQTENGWELVNDGKSYLYSCEVDGLYLYLDWEGKNQYTLDFRYKKIYRKTVGHTGDFSATTLNFLCKNKDEKYVYVAGWDEFDGNIQQLKEIMFPTDGNIQPIIPYNDFKTCFNLMEKYTSN